MCAVTVRVCKTSFQPTMSDVGVKGADLSKNLSFALRSGESACGGERCFHKAFNPVLYRAGVDVAARNGHVLCLIDQVLRAK